MEISRVVRIRGHNGFGHQLHGGIAEGQEFRSFAPFRMGRSSTAAPGDGSAPTSRSGNRTLVLRLGQRLDISALGLMNRILRSPHSTSIGQVVLDLGATTQLFDSGLALLLMLHARAGPLRERIHIVNCRPAVQHRLDESGVGALFDQHLPTRDPPAQETPAPRQAEIAWTDLAQAVELLGFQDSALICLDQDRLARFCNRGAERLFRRSGLEIVGQSCSDLVRERVPGSLQTAFAQVRGEPLPSTVALDDCRLVALDAAGREIPVAGSLAHFRLCGEDGYALLLRDVGPQLELDDRALPVRASIGLARYPQHVTTPLELLRHADQSMYRVKARAKAACDLPREAAPPATPSGGDGTGAPDA